jgi:predicted ribosome quality control (RQC) complex YloA/Tae2 family protein
VPDDEDETRPPDETGEALRSEFIIETMERRSNIMLVDDTNIILESVKRVPAHVSQRVILPHQPYEVPPRQDKRDPRSVTADGIAALRSLEQPGLVRALVKGYQGVSPQAAREIVSRALGRTDARIDEDVPWDTLAACMRELFTDAPEPTLVPGDEQPRAYAPYRLTHIAGAQPQPGMSAALEAFYAARETLTDHRQRRDAVQQQLDATRQRLQQQLTQMQRELEHVENVDYLRWEGEMIFAFLHTLEPGQTTLDVEGHTITLDPEHSPVENAQARFQTYQRAHSGRESLHERLRETRARLDGLEQLAALLAMSDEREQIDQLAQEAEEQGYIKPAGKPGKKKRAVRRKPLHLVSSDGIDVYVGRSSAQNEDVTFRIGRPDDVWLHVRTIPGAHVIVRSSGDDVPERTLAEAAGLAAYFSPSRHEAAVDVDMARRSRVRRVPGGTPGLVTYRAERTLHVPPLPPWS